jgi:hypothetical protein
METGKALYDLNTDPLELTNLIADSVGEKSYLLFTLEGQADISIKLI